MHKTFAFAPLLALLGCQAPPAADPEFSDAARFAFREFDTEEPARLAFAIRSLERTIYLGYDLEADSSRDRASTPEYLDDSDVVGIDTPGLPLSDALPVAVGLLSGYEIDQHRQIALLADQTPVEPGSPDHYERTINEGADCWIDRGCDYLRTVNNLTKANALITVTYDLYKDYRWIDLNLPDPSSVAEGEPVVNEGEPRWAYTARSWITEQAVADNGNSIDQSLSVEVWLPRDGGGFVRDGETNTDKDDDGEPDGDWTTDSSGGGSVRMMALWSQATLGAEISDEIVQNTVRVGIDDIFQEAEVWLEENTR